MNDEHPGPFLVLAGPTAVGKTAWSLELARHLNAEIISADSRQVYRGLDVGTAKPSAAAQALVVHHFIDELPLGAGWSAGRFAAAANARIRAVLDRGRVPLVIGGSTLYIEALVHGLADVPAGAPPVRADLAARLAMAGGAEALYAELKRLDPAGAATMDPTKTQRLLRALAVCHTTGRPWSSFFATAVPPPYRYRVVVLTRPRESLYSRIEARVEAMLQAGLLDENRRLMAEGFRLDTNPLRTIGYQEPIAYLTGQLSYPEMVRQLKRNSRRYAKRQLTWFRRRAAYCWLDVETEVQGVDSFFCNNGPST